MRVEVKQGLALMLGTGATAGLSLLFVIYAGRTLSTVEFGEFTALLAIMSLGFSAMGPVHETMTRLAAQHHALGRLGQLQPLAAKFTRRIAWIAAGLVVMGLVLSPVIKRQWNMASLLPVSLAFVTMGLVLFVTTWRGLLRGAHRFGALNCNQVAEAGVRLIVGVVLLSGLLITSSVGGALLAFLVAASFSLVLARWQVRALWDPVPSEQLPPLLESVAAFLGPMFAFAMLRAGHEQLDMLIVKYVLPADDAGLYGAAFSLTRAISVAATPFATLMLPLLATAKARGQSGSGSFLLIIAGYIFLILPVLGLCLAWPAGVLRLLYGDSPLVEAHPYLGLMMVGRAAVYLTALLGLMLAAVGRFRFLFAYGCGLLIQLAAMSAVAKSAGPMLKVVVICQGLTLVLILAAVVSAILATPAGAKDNDLPDSAVT